MIWTFLIHAGYSERVTLALNCRWQQVLGVAHVFALVPAKRVRRSLGLQARSAHSASCNRHRPGPACLF